jgi:hypothetical protein
MDIAKPPGGFNIIEPATVTQLIASHASKWARLQAHWADIKTLLKQTGHRVGERVAHGPRGARVYKAAGDTAANLPTVKVAYTVLGETVQIYLVVVED